MKTNYLSKLSKALIVTAFLALLLGKAAAQTDLVLEQQSLHVYIPGEHASGGGESF